MNIYIHRLINNHNVSDVSQELESMKNITADITLNYYTSKMGKRKRKVFVFAVKLFDVLIPAAVKPKW